MKKKWKQQLVWCLTGALLMGLLPVQGGMHVKAAEEPDTSPVSLETETPVPTETPAWLVPEITYDAAKFENMVGRTEEESAKKYVAARFADQGYDEEDITSIYRELPSFEAPYTPGRLSDATLKSLTAMWNYYRWLVGSMEGIGDTSQEPFGGETEWHKMQERAYFCNFQTLAAPEDFPEGKWQRPSFSNVYGVGNTPLEALKDSVNVQASGRKWNSDMYYDYTYQRELLSPGRTCLSMGFCGRMLVSEPFVSSSLEYTQVETPFYSFPSQGYMPNDLMKVSNTAWTVGLRQGVLSIPSSKDVSVTIYHRESGKTYERSVAKENMCAIGGDGYIIFEEPAEEGMSVYTGTYDVEVTGLLDVATGKGAKVRYSVTFFDGAKYLTAKVREVSLDGVVNIVLPQQPKQPEVSGERRGYTLIPSEPLTFTGEHIEKITAILPEQVTVTGENGRSVILPVKGKWIFDAAQSCWKNSVDAALLPSGLTDSDGVLSDFPIRCELGDNQGLTFEMDWAKSFESTNNPVAGRGGRMTIRKNPASEIESVSVYRIAETDGTYTSKIRYDTKSSWGTTENAEEHTFTIPVNYLLEDTGDFLAAGYVKGSRTIWLSDVIIPIQVVENTTSGGSGNTGGNTGGGNNAGNTGGNSGGGTNVGNTGGNTGGGNNAGNTGGNSGGGTNVGNTGGSTAGGNGSNTGGNGVVGSQEQKKQEDSKKTSIPKVAKVKNCKLKADKRGLVLTWKKQTGVSGYQIQVSTKKNFKGAKKFSLKKSKAKCRITNLKPGKKYYVRIRAYKTYQTQTGNRKKSYGKWGVKNRRTKG